MAFPRKLLAPGEDIVLDTHPNWSILVPRTSAFLLVVAACVAIVVAWASAPLWFGYVLLAIAGVFLLALLAKVAVWRSTTLVLTNRRVVYRTGVFRRLGREIPLDRVQDVTYSQSLAERLVGAGSLTIESAGAGGEEPFPDIRHPAVVQSLINRLITVPSPGYGQQAPGGLGGAGYPSPQNPPPGQQPQYPQQPYPQPQYQQPQYQQPQYPQPQYPQPQPQYPQPDYGQQPYQQPQYPQPEYPQTPPQGYREQSSPPPQTPPQSAPQPAPAPVPPPSPPYDLGEGLSGSSSEQLRHLEDLLRLGVITEAEYQTKRRDLLEGR